MQETIKKVPREFKNNSEFKEMVNVSFLLDASLDVKRGVDKANGFIDMIQDSPYNTYINPIQREVVLNLWNYLRGKGFMEGDKVVVNGTLAGFSKAGSGGVLYSGEVTGIKTRHSNHSVIATGLFIKEEGARANAKDREADFEVVAMDREVHPFHTELASIGVYDLSYIAEKAKDND